MTTFMMNIQTFSSPEEIRALSNFHEDNPLTKDNYKGIVGDYHFGEDVACCFQKKSGNLCLHAHRRGWLVELLNGTVTLLGNDCASVQFDLDSKLIGDRRRYDNEKRRRERLASISDFIAQKGDRLEQLAQLRSRLEDLRARSNAFVSEFGPNTRNQLIALARSGRPDVMIKGVKLRVYEDEEGKQKTERSVTHTKLGTLHGLDLIRPDSFYLLFDAMKDVIHAHQEAEELGEKPKVSEVDRLAARLGEYDRILKEGERLFTLETSLLGNNFMLLCYVTQDADELDAIKIKLMTEAGEVGGKKKARAWFSGKNKELATALGVDKIELV